MDHSMAALCLAAGAGLATGIGSALALILHGEQRKLLAFLLGSASGVMLFGALTEILGKGRAQVALFVDEQSAYLYSALALFCGMALLLGLERLLPEDGGAGGSALLIGISLAAHNFPEGLATYTAALADPQIAYPMVIAIALHNIPEGLAVAVPMLAGGASKPRAFFCSFATGLAEPVGALFGAFVLTPALDGMWMGLLFSFAAGMMAYLALFELLPRALAQGQRAGVCGTLCGMALMSLSLLLFL